ncbi:MAG: hypothetical protein HUU55_09865 [Myxococcales bacterium]|nr:hypothetical protein [Myxococcales bacterium]
MLKFLYFRVLSTFETVVLTILLAVTVGLSFTEILNRNFAWHLWDASAVNMAIYSTTFYCGLFGAVVATRRLRHIRIDALAPYLPHHISTKMDGITSWIASLACIWLAIVAVEFIQSGIIAIDDQLVPGKEGWFWQTRLWKWPMVIGFALMALHFAVAGTFRILGKSVHQDEISPAGGEN